MRVQTKLLLSTLPILLGGFLLSGVLLFRMTREIMSEDAGDYIETVLESRVEHTLQHRATLLTRTRMDKVVSFVRLYQQESMADLSVGADSTYGCFAVFTKSGERLYDSPSCGTLRDSEALKRAASLAHSEPARLVRGVVDSANQRIVGARHFTPWDWALVYSIDARRIDLATNRVLATTVAVAGACALACAAAIWLAFRRVFGEGIQRLKDAAAAIARRESNIVISERSNDELGELGESLNEMAVAIRDHSLAQDRLKAQLEQSNEKLSESEASLKRAAEAGNVGLWTLDCATSEVTFSTVWKHQLGFEDSELPNVYEEWVGRLHPEDREKTLATVTESITKPWPPYRTEFRLRHKDGSYRNILAIGATTHDEGDTALRLQGSHVDITELKSAQEERLRLEERLHQAQRLESVGRLAGGVAHDFNNMLGVILGQAELTLMDSTLIPSSRAALNDIMEAAQRSAELTQQLLAFARRQNVVPRVLDLNESIGRSLKLLQRLTSENVQLTWAPQATVPWVQIDPSQLGQVLTNLCVNASHAITGPGRITVETINTFCDSLFCKPHEGASAGPYVRLTVSDTGCGMSEETRSKMFEPFFTTKQAGVGTGLGLATVFGIVQQNQGFISVQSTPGAGTTVAIFLPLCSPAPESAVAGPEQSWLGKGTVLLVEDEEALLDLAKAMLERLGYEVLPARGSVEALQHAASHEGTIDLLVTDVVLPEMTGEEVRAQVTALRPQVRTLFVSGYPEEVTLKHGLSLGQANLLQKPFTMQSLGMKMRATLEMA